MSLNKKNNESNDNLSDDNMSEITMNENYYHNDDSNFYQDDDSNFYQDDDSNFYQDDDSNFYQDDDSNFYQVSDSDDSYEPSQELSLTEEINEVEGNFITNLISYLLDFFKSDDTEKLLN